MRLEDYNPNLTEIAERVLLGPQAEIVGLIEQFNLHYEASLKATKTFRWSPGVGIQLQKIYKERVLQWEKKYSGVYHFFNRIDNANFWHRSLKDRLNRIDTLMRGMRTRGISFQNNTQLVVDTFEKYKAKALEEIDSITSTYSESDLMVSADIIDYEENDGINTRYQFKFIFPNPTMDIYNEDAHLVKIKLYPIELKFDFKIIDHVNKMASNRTVHDGSVVVKGKYLAPSDTIYHPYLNMRYSRRSNNGWYDVCLGDMVGDIRKAIYNFDFEAAAILLIQWTSRYHTNRTHPHNKPNTAYYGMPKWLYDQDGQSAYVSAFPHNSDNCGVPNAISNLATDHNRNVSITNDNTCNDIECAMRDTCKYYQNVVNLSEERANNLNILSPNGDYIHVKAFDHRFDDDTIIVNKLNKILKKEIEEEVDLECMSDEEIALRWVQRTIERSR